VLLTMPACKRCKLWHYRETELCSFCKGLEKEEKELILNKRCTRCEKKVERYYRKRLCSSCSVEIKERKAVQEKLDITNKLLKLVEKDK